MNLPNNHSKTTAPTGSTIRANIAVAAKQALRKTTFSKPLGDRNLTAVLLFDRIPSRRELLPAAADRRRFFPQVFHKMWKILARETFMSDSLWLRLRNQLQNRSRPGGILHLVSTLTAWVEEESGRLVLLAPNQRFLHTLGSELSPGRRSSHRGPRRRRNLRGLLLGRRQAAGCRNRGAKTCRHHVDSLQSSLRVRNLRGR